MKNFKTKKIQLESLEDVESFFQNMEDEEKFEQIHKAFEYFFKTDDDVVVCWELSFLDDDRVVKIVVDDIYAEDIIKEYLDMSIESEKYEWSRKFQAIYNKLKENNINFL